MGTMPSQQPQQSANTSGLALLAGELAATSPMPTWAVMVVFHSPTIRYLLISSVNIAYAGYAGCGRSNLCLTQSYCCAQTYKSPLYPSPRFPPPQAPTITAVMSCLVLA